MVAVCKKYGHYTDLIYMFDCRSNNDFEELSRGEPGRSSMMLPSDPGWETSGWKKMYAAGRYI
jgi:hypothetical protein